MAGNDQDALTGLTIVGQLREQKAMAQSVRARRAVRAWEVACHEREIAADALDQARERARVQQFRDLHVGRPMPGLQRFIDSAEVRRRRELHALADDRERLNEALAEARNAAKAVAAAQERAKVFADMLAAWRSGQEAALDDEDGL